MRVLIALAASAAVIALVLAAYAVGTFREAETEASLGRIETAVGDLERRIDGLQGVVRDELAAARKLRDRARELTIRPAAGQGGEDANGAADGSAEPVPEVVHVLVEKLERIEGKLQEMDRTARTPVVVPTVGGTVETEAERQAVVQDNQAVAVDPSRSTAERVRALRELRFRDGRTLEVTLAMIELMRDPATPARLRADIVRQLDEVTFPELKEPLIDAVLHDPEAEVRGESAETLQPFLDDPRVEEVLRHVKDNDPDHRVRREAEARLEGFTRRGGEE